MESAINRVATCQPNWSLSRSGFVYQTKVIKVKIQCPACSAVLEIDTSMSGQVVDCECGKKLRVPTVGGKNPGQHSAPSSSSEELDGEKSAADRSPQPPQTPQPPQSSTSNAGVNAGPDPASNAASGAGFGAPEQNPFTTTSSDLNPYAASNSPHGGTIQPVPMQTGGEQGLAIASLVLGICSLTLVCCGGFLIGIPAVICGVIAIKKANRGEATGKGMAIAGVSTGGISLALFVGYVILVILSELM